MLNRQQKRSRLSRFSEKQNKNQAFKFGLGIVAVITVLLIFGPTIINLFGNVIYSIRGNESDSNSKLIGKEILQPPVLIGVPEATQSSKISFNGTVNENKGIVEIYVNDDLSQEISIEDNKFEASSISLQKGKNLIKSRWIIDNETSPFTEEYEVNFLADKPKLEVSFPQDGATYTKADKNITVQGTTDPDNSVSVNSFRAIVESDGSFNYLLQLNDGENTLLVEAQNPAGVTTQKQIKVTYNP